MARRRQRARPADRPARWSTSTSWSSGPAKVARSLARRAGGVPFPLSERHGAWRVVRDGGAVDITASRGAVADDLGRRDFTINAMAVPLAGGELLDPHGGRPDLEARRVRTVSERVFADDPLRLLRLARLAHELGFTVDPEAERLARRDAHLATGRAVSACYRDPAAARARAPGLGHPPARPPGRARRGAARGGRDAGRRAEPVPPPGRVRAHAAGARRGGGHRRAPGPLPARGGAPVAAALPPGWATGSTATPVCALRRSSTTSRSRRPASSPRTAGSASWGTTGWVPRPPSRCSRAGGPRRR